MKLIRKEILFVWYCAGFGSAMLIILEFIFMIYYPLIILEAYYLGILGMFILLYPSLHYDHQILYMHKWTKEEIDALRKEYDLKYGVRKNNKKSSR